MFKYRFNTKTQCAIFHIISAYMCLSMSVHLQKYELWVCWYSVCMYVQVICKSKCSVCTDITSAFINFDSMWKKFAINVLNGSAKL